MRIKFRKNIRLKGYDYSANGYYFVTVVTRDRLPLLKPYRNAIEATIKDLPKFINGLSIDYFKLMDNHIHIIFIRLRRKPRVLPVDECVNIAATADVASRIEGGPAEAKRRRVDRGTTGYARGGSIFKNCLRPLGRLVGAMKYSITKIVAAGLPSSKKANGNSPATDKTIWQRNYYEHIIRNEESLQKIREYIDNNPLAEMMDWKHFEVSGR